MQLGATRTSFSRQNKLLLPPPPLPLTVAGAVDAARRYTRTPRQLQAGRVPRGARLRDAAAGPRLSGWRRRPPVSHCSAAGRHTCGALDAVGAGAAGARLGLRSAP
eukprot:scaffold23883_cov103-Isochrysis_galbana.AAC.1